MKCLMSGLFGVFAILTVLRPGAFAATPKIALVADTSESCGSLVEQISSHLKNARVIALPDSAPFGEQGVDGANGGSRPEYVVLIRIHRRSKSADESRYDVVASVTVVRAATSKLIYSNALSRTVGRIDIESPLFFLMFPQTLLALPLGLSMQISETSAIEDLARDVAVKLDTVFKSPSITSSTPASNQTVNRLADARIGQDVQ